MLTNLVDTPVCGMHVISFVMLSVAAFVFRIAIAAFGLYSEP